MYGDCQIMSSMAMGGGNVVSPETLFPSPIQNPNFNFMPAHHQLPFQPLSPILSPPKEENGVVMMMRGKEYQMLERGSGSDQVEEQSGNEQEAHNQLQPPKKKRYHRHTAHQIQEMENLFKECPHPDDKQRMKLSQDLWLKPRQVKFWFQNWRTQMKAQQDRSDNVMLRTENENLKNKNYRLQAALCNIMCLDCGGPAMIGGIGIDEQHLPPLMSASSLDLDMNIYARHFQEYPMTSCTEIIHMPLLPPHVPFPYPVPAGITCRNDSHASVTLGAELMKMCQTGEPLWIRNSENGKEVLNLEEHARIFPLRTEATRDSAVVIMNGINLVNAFLDVNKWMELFPSIVSRAKTVQVISADPSGQANGSLQLMYAELQVVSPLVPTREAYFLRYCQQNEEEGSWAIVDFPTDSFHDNLQSSFARYKRWPSGCLIQDMPHGYSRVTWIERAEIEEKSVHQIFSHYVYSGMAFGAQRWLAVLQRQCERVASLMARNISDLGVMPSPEARKNIMKLAQRMTKTVCVNMSTSNGQSWTALSDSPDDTVRITTRKVTDPGQPIGVIVTAVSTTWLTYSHYRVFELLREERHRAQLDVLTNGNSLHEVAHVANGFHPGNCISLFSRKSAPTSQATMDVDGIQLAMSGEDPSCIPLLPLGFVIVPVLPMQSSTSTAADHGSTSPDQNHESSVMNTGCLLTVGLQVLASTSPSAKLKPSSAIAINNHLCNSVQQIISVGNICTTTTTTDDDNGSVGDASGGSDHPTAASLQQ
ncbi:homeobox-leucine zipper protein ROC3-like [Pyrus ussuriensis x Pyrus communis]|uniref:Homeobox-leucine zipper protein ROC3-like n=1 Tax=Pyrus ussuriensis x Pyrus communis TaxID=2448454 RepID=A0A5N5HDT9_9ROSA|nr:homeobox-leucine zipper protein ROC3-like [Pyrus ussuriensis x Pyrus communis]